MINNRLFIEENNKFKVALYNKDSKQAKNKGLFNKLRDIKKDNFLFLSLTKVQQVNDLKTKCK